MGERKLTLGMKGDDVKSVQTKLIALGYLTGKADGVYGTATESAIRRFQTRNGLTSDGICGEDTVKAHLSTIFAKLGVDNRVSAAMRVRAAGRGGVQARCCGVKWRRPRIRWVGLLRCGTRWRAFVRLK